MKPKKTEKQKVAIINHYLANNKMGLTCKVYNTKPEYVLQWLDQLEKGLIGDEKARKLIKAGEFNQDVIDYLCDKARFVKKPKGMGDGQFMQYLYELEQKSLVD